MVASNAVYEGKSEDDGRHRVLDYTEVLSSSMEL